MLFLEVVERLETDDGLADTESHVSSLHERELQRRTRKQRLKSAMIAPGRVALRGGKAALHGVAHGVGGPTAWVITKSRAGVGATVDGVRERKAKLQQRKEAALAHENDPFAITETPVEKTARMQQVAPPAVGITGDLAPGAASSADDSTWSGGAFLTLDGSTWDERKQRVQAQTAWREVPGWGLAAVLVKADDDLRQHMFCMHLIALFQRTFRRAGLDELADGLRPYTIQATSACSGLIEALPDAKSVAEIKRRTLKAHNSAALEFIYRLQFGGGGGGGGGGRGGGGGWVGSSKPAEAGEATTASTSGSLRQAPAEAAQDTSPTTATAEAGDGSAKPSLEEARRNCMHSVAAYSLVQYILQLKDRHNGNVLLDSSGRLVHVDFSFILGWAPGGITFEKAPFKLTKDVVDVWGGRGSPLWEQFVQLIVKGLQALQIDHIAFLRDVEVMAASGARFPFLRQMTLPRKRLLQLLRRRFKLYKSEAKLRRYAICLIDEAYDNFWTRTYAKFQLLTNGIPP